jgi:hypothetical protein
MTNEEIKLKFPIGKLYQIVFNTFDDDFVAIINNKNVTFPSRETVFLMLDIEYQCKPKYCNITALFPSCQVGTISYLYASEIKMLKQ